MNGEKSKHRPYASPLRRQQQEHTRKQIMEAVTAIIAEGRILSFSVQDVADRAGVSYASVYRHFPTREALLDALYEAGAKIVGTSLALTSLAPEEIPAAVGRMRIAFEQDPASLQASTMALAISSIHPPSRRQRDQRYQRVIAESAPHLAPSATNQAAAVICHLHSSLTWVTLRQRFGLSAEETADALTWALQTLIRDLIRANEGNS